MLIENNTLELKYLTELGFTIDCFSNNSGFWINKNFKSKYLTHIKIFIVDFNDEGIIIVDIKNKYEEGYFTIIEKKYSRKNLKKLMKFLKLK